MTAAAVLYDLAAAGVTIAAQGDRLRFWPRSAVGPDLLTRLRDHKAELLQMIRGGGADHDRADAKSSGSFPSIAQGAPNGNSRLPADSLANGPATTTPAGPSGEGNADAPNGNSRVCEHTCLAGPDPRIIADPVTADDDYVLRCWNPDCNQKARRSVAGRGRRYCPSCGIEPRKPAVVVPFTRQPRPRLPGCNHLDPAAWVQRSGKAYCPGCNKFLGYMTRTRPRGKGDILPGG